MPAIGLAGRMLFPRRAPPTRSSPPFLPRRHMAAHHFRLACLTLTPGPAAVDCPSPPSRASWLLAGRASPVLLPALLCHGGMAACPGRSPAATAKKVPDLPRAQARVAPALPGLALRLRVAQVADAAE